MRYSATILPLALLASRAWALNVPRDSTYGAEDEDCDDEISMTTPAAITSAKPSVTADGDRKTSPAAIVSTSTTCTTSTTPLPVTSPAVTADGVKSSTSLTTTLTLDSTTTLIVDGPSPTKPAADAVVSSTTCTTGGVHVATTGAVGAANYPMTNSTAPVEVANVVASDTVPITSAAADIAAAAYTFAPADSYSTASVEMQGYGASSSDLPLQQTTNSAPDGVTFGSGALVAAIIGLVGMGLF